MTKSRRPRKPAVPDAEAERPIYRALQSIGDYIRPGDLLRRTPAEARPLLDAGSIELVVQAGASIPDPPPPRGGLVVALREMRLHRFGETVPAGTVVYLSGDSIDAYVRSDAVRRVTLGDLAPDDEVSS